MVKKVGIITQHRVVNYGSALQAYALQKKITDLGYSCEVIDYYPERFTPLGMLQRIKNKGHALEKSFLLRMAARVVIMPSYIVRFHRFHRFIFKYLNLTQKTYTSEEELEKENFNYDVFCTGSDQVWNYGWNEKIEYPYFLAFAPKSARKISYAASFGKSELEPFEVDETRRLLTRYNEVSVRELSGVSIVKRLGIPTCVNVLDPTLLLTGDEWRNIASDKHICEKYILTYNLNRNPKIDAYARGLSQQTGFQVRYLTYQFHEFYKHGKMCCNPNVEDFLSLIDGAQYIITDSFHATAFSLNFNKEFVIVYPGKYSTRLQSILSILGLTSRVARDEKDMSIISSKIDYAHVNELLATERMRSLAWLKSALGGK